MVEGQFFCVTARTTRRVPLQQNEKVIGAGTMTAAGESLLLQWYYYQVSSCVRFSVLLSICPNLQIIP